MRKHLFRFFIAVPLGLDALIAWRAWCDGSQSTLAICLAVAVAVCAFWQTDNLAKRRAFLEFVGEFNSDDRVEVACVILRSAVKPFAHLTSEEKSALKYLFNQFELLAMGLSKGIYDQRMVGNYFGSELVRMHDKAKPYIADIRELGGEMTKKAYLEFEKLANQVRKSL